MSGRFSAPLPVQFTLWLYDVSYRDKNASPELFKQFAAVEEKADVLMIDASANEPQSPRSSGSPRGTEFNGGDLGQLGSFHGYVFEARFPELLLTGGSGSDLERKLTVMKATLQSWNQLLMMLDENESGKLSPLELGSALMAFAAIGLITEPIDLTPMVSERFRTLSLYDTHGNCAVYLTGTVYI